MKKAELYETVLSYLGEQFSGADTELDYKNSFELIVSVVLSAQCTDKRINKVTPRLFQDFPTAEALAATTPEVVFEYIKSVSYPNNKAKHLVGLGKVLVEKFGGQVPEAMEDLTQLPGVGRKTANVIRAIVFKKAALAVDTHVFRVSHRLGLVPQRCTTPLSVELELKRHIPESQVADSHFWLLMHGRYVCTARIPHCGECGLKAVCSYFQKENGVGRIKKAEK